MQRKRSVSPSHTDTPYTLYHWKSQGMTQVTRFIKNIKCENIYLFGGIGI